MKAVRCCDQKVVVAEVAAPAGDGVRVRISSAGICGSDLHLLNSEYAPAVTLGHEIAGIAENGQPVAIEPMTPCGHCDCCRRDDYHLCRNSFDGLIGVSVDGGMADEIRVPSRCLVPLPSGLPTADACLIEPLAVAVHGLRLADVDAGDRVAIIGGGSIGLCAAAACRDVGLTPTLFARHDAQREAALRLGAQLDKRDEYDLVIDCAGSASAVNQGIELCRPGGRLLLLATYWSGLDINAIGMCMKEVRLIPAAMYSKHGDLRDIDQAAALFARQPEIAKAIISHRYPLAAAPEAFATAADRAAGAIKVVLEPG